jgi:hypothetical protein
MVVPSLKARYVDVYLPSEAAKREWEAEAKKAGLPMSKFILEAVEAFRAAQKENQRYDMVKELAELRDENQELRRELKMKTLLIEKLEAECFKARYADFQEIDIRDGTRSHDEELIKVLKHAKVLDGYSILKKLSIDPRDTEAVKLVNNQLESLKRFGLVEETPSGWRWIS